LAKPINKVFNLVKFVPLLNEINYLFTFPPYDANHLGRNKRGGGFGAGEMENRFCDGD
jgi:hypothetical protein